VLEGDDVADEGVGLGPFRSAECATGVVLLEELERFRREADLLGEFVHVHREGFLLLSG
jgi:hypothetical protein